MKAPLRRELPILIVEISLLVVLLHANAPEVWFWFSVLVVLLGWRCWAWYSRRQQALLEQQAGPAPAPGEG